MQAVGGGASDLSLSSPITALSSMIHCLWVVVINPYISLSYDLQESSWPRGWGQLSKFGQERHLELGKFFRRRYADLIGEFYHPWDIHVRSTDVDRTLMSAASNLAGDIQ